MSTLAWQVVFVTGGSRGIGRTLATALAKDGAVVALSARALPAAEAVVGEIAAAGGRAVAVALDVRNRAEVDGAVERILDVYGRIDVLVNNAGVGGAAPSESLTDELVGAVRFLAAPEASYITGAVSSIDGGWAAYSFL